MKKRTYRASIHVGGRTYSEVLDMEEEREYFDESEWVGKKVDWETYTRPVTTRDMDDLNGNHLLFGWLESIFQSDRSPHFCLTEYNNDKSFVYQFE